MFDTTHDAVLLVFAVLYVLVALSRSIQFANFTPRAQYHVGSSWVSVPLFIAAILALVAVFW